MTKAKMRQFLRYKLNQLDKTMEVDKFYVRTEELFYKLRRMPPSEWQQKSFENQMDTWEGYFYNMAKRVDFNEQMRRQSANKKYQKPSLGPQFSEHAYSSLKMIIDYSLLPK